MKTTHLIKHVVSQEVDPAFAQRAEYILNKVRTEKPKRILDAGCGRGFYVKVLSLMKEPIEIVGIDIKEEYLEKARKNTANDKRVKILNASIYELPFKDGYFDCVISSEVLEHLDDDEMAVKEIHRVLKKKGIFLSSVPHKNFPFFWDPLNWLLMHIFRTHVNKNIWWLAGIWADHERLYTKDDYRKVLKNTFETVYIKDILHWCWPCSHLLLYGIGKNMVERFGSKEFNRFNFAKKTPLSIVLAKVMALPSILLDKRFPRKASMGLVALSRKG